MKAIILAAGRNNRIHPPIDIPKCLIKIGDKTLLEHSLSNLSDCGVKEAIIVVGYLADEVIQKIGNECEGVKIKYVRSDMFDQTDNLYSLWLAKSEFNDDIVYMDADILYDKRALAKLLNSDYENGVLVGKLYSDTGEEMKVFGEGEVAKNIGRGISVEGSRLIGEAVGIVKISSKHIRSLIENMNLLVKNKDFMSHEDLTNAMCEKNLMNYVHVKDLPWVEIDFREDIEKAKKEIYPKIKDAEV